MSCALLADVTHSSAGDKVCHPQQQQDFDLGFQYPNQRHKFVS